MDNLATQTEESLSERRARLFKEWDEDYPPIDSDFLITSSGVVEQIPDAAEERDEFFETNKKWGGI